VNDIAVVGAEPLFFLDYIGTGRLEPKVFNEILSGLTTACMEAGCALIGGETAQMPGIYHGGDYDLVGCIVGVVERKKIIDGARIKPGDVIVGFPSTGLHTNGYSLAREILFNKLGLPVQLPMPGTKQTLGSALLMPHANYRPLLQKLSKKVTFKGLSHITGGGFVDNLPRILPAGVDAVIRIGTWPSLPIFDLLEQRGGVKREELYQVFNMGIVITAVVSAKDAPKILERSKAYVIGQIVKGTGKVQLEF